MSFFFLYIFIFMVFWRPQAWLIPALYGIPILDAVVFLAILGLLIEHDEGKLNTDIKRPHFFLLFGLFFAALMSHLSHFYLAGLLMSWMSAFRICFFGILLFATMDKTSRMLSVARVFVFMSCFMAIHGILQQTRGYGFGGQLPVMSWRPGLDIMVARSKFFGIFEDPNDMGQMLATAMPLAFVITKRRNLMSLALGAGICYLLWVGLKGTWSRGSEIGLIVASALMIIQIFPARWFIKLFGLCTLGGLAILPFSGPFLDGSALERIDFWGQANWAFKLHPIFGVGLGMIGEYIHRGRAVHNAYVMCYSQLGVFGYFFWFSLIVVTLYGLVQTKKALKSEKGTDAKWLHRFSCWGIASFCGFLASSYFLSRAFIFPLFFLISMLGAVPYVTADTLEDRTKIHLLSVRETCNMGIPISILSIVYVYISIILLNRAR